jgi:YggT family protein
MRSLLWLINTVLQLYIYVIIASVVMSWLVAFDVINLRNRFVRMFNDAINALINPLLKPIRRIVPAPGGIDFSPMVLFLLILFLRYLINEYWPTSIR